MIELEYIEGGSDGGVFQVIQFRSGESWRVARDGELLASIEKAGDTWQGRVNCMLTDELVQRIGEYIDGQHFNRLPKNLKAHWSQYVTEVVVQDDSQYLVICKSGIDFDRFEKIFKAYISILVKDEWEIRFRVFNADMSSDFEVLVKLGIMK